MRARGQTCERGGGGARGGPGALAIAFRGSATWRNLFTNTQTMAAADHVGAAASRDDDDDDDDDDERGAAADAKPTRAIVPTAEARAAATWDEGVDVEARFEGGNRFYAATIERARSDGLYDLVYEGGVREAGVPPALIRREGAWR